MERERNKSLSPGEKEKMERNILENEKEWGLIDLYNKDNQLT
jgi:hypothetical protein